MEQLEQTSDPVLQSFLGHFNYTQVTVSIQDVAGKTLPKLSQGNLFSPYTRIRAIPISLFFKDSVQAEIIEANSKGYAIYFLFNEGDGKAVDKSLNCGKNENIIKLKSLVIDTDKAPMEEVSKKLQEIKFYPHLVINTSPGRYHLYFLLEDTPVNSQNRAYWESIQKKLFNLCEGLDRTTAKICQALRLPGFFHTKGEPFPITLVRDNTSKIAKYNLKEVYDRLEAYKYNEDYLASAPAPAREPSSNGFHTNGTYTQKPKYAYPKGKIKEGGRHDELLKFINHIAENHHNLDTPDELYKYTVYGFIDECFEKPQDFKEGGERAAEILKIIKDVKKKRKLDHDRKEAFSRNLQFAEAEHRKEETLPDKFYLEFPGDLGMLTKFINKTHPNLSLELCFAGALCFSGALKADLLRCRNAWPYVNGFVLAPTGTGKTTLIKILEQLSDAAGLRGEYSQVIDMPISVQALHADIYKAGGSANVLIDEAGDYIQSLSLKSTSGYGKAVRPYMKKGTSSSSKVGTYLHPGRSKNNTDPAFTGMFSVWLFSQPSMFYASVDLDSMSDGFIPRFFIFKGASTYDYTSYMQGRSEGIIELTPEVEVLIAGLNSIRSKINYTEIDEQVTKEIELRKADKDNKVRLKKEDLKLARLYDFKYKARLMDTKDVEFTTEAERVLTDYLQSQERETLLLKEERGEGTPEEALMVRTQEMMLRLICNAASWDGQKAVVDLDMVENCIKFYSFQRSRFLEGEAGELYKTWAEKQSDIVYKAVVKAHKKHGVSCTVGQIMACIKADKRPDNIDKVLMYLNTLGRISISVRMHKVTREQIKTYGPPVSETPEVDSTDLVN